MANLSNINNKFIVTDGGNGRVLIGATNDIGATLFANHPSTTAPSLTFNAPAGQVFENEDLQIAFGLNNASPYNAYMQTRFVSAPFHRSLAINPLGGNVGIGTNSPGRELEVIGVIKANGTFMSTASSSSTNLATGNGGQLSLFNSNSTNGNFSNIGGYNSNSLVTSQICFINESHTSRTGAIAFLTHNGSSMPERMRIDESGNINIGTANTSQIFKINTPSLNTSFPSYLQIYGVYTSSISEINIEAVGVLSGGPYGSRLSFSTSDQASLTKRLVIDPSGVVTVGTAKRYVDSGNTQFDLEVTEGMAFGGNAFTFATIQGDSAGHGNIEICANAYPANTGAESKITFKTSTSSGGQYTDALVIKGPNVGIGTISPSYGKLQIDQTSGNNLTLRKGTGTAAVAFGGVTNNEATFLIEGHPAASGFKLYNGAGTLASPTWTAGMDFYDGGRLHPYGGVFLGSSNNSNLLNYYASDTWTPTVTTSQLTNPTITSSSGRWQRVGKVVTASFEFTMSNPTVGAGSVIINNLPIAFADNDHVSGCGVIGDLGKTINVRYYTGNNQIAMNFYDGNYCGTAFRTVGTVTYWAAT